MIQPVPLLFQMFYNLLYIVTIRTTSFCANEEGMSGFMDGGIKFRRFPF